MKKSLQFAKAEAEREFLGRHNVVAIAISNAPVQHLVFFFDKVSDDTRQTILHWAKRQGITVNFRVVGQFVPTV